MSAMKAGMSRNTARKYPGQTDAMEQRQVPHTWRTRKDPLEAVWEQALAMLREAPELEAKALFEHLAQGRGEELTPGAYGTTADVASLNFTTWEGWTGGANSGPPSTLGKDAVMHIPGSDIYLDIKFTAWGGAAGGFSYTRSSPPASALAAWRLLHFGSAANSGDGADGNDFDQDGLTNLLEYAFGQDPKSAAARALPQPQFSAGSLSVTFSGVPDIRYKALWSTTLRPGSWTPIPDAGTGITHSFSTPANGAARTFLRFFVLTQ